MKIGSGATPRGGQDAYRGGATALIRSQNVHNWGFSSDGLAFIDEQQADELSNVVVERSDVLLNITGDSVARCCMAPEEAFPARVNQHVLIIRTDPSVLHSRYLRYWMVAPTSQQHLLSLASAGATRNALTRAMVSDLRFDVPPLLEQRAIASVLGALDDKIDLNRRMCQTLEEMARALFKSWFVDFDPVRAKMQGRDPGLPKEMADLFPNRLVDSELGPIPEGWHPGTVEDATKLNPESWSVKSRPTVVRYLDLASAKWGRLDDAQELSGEAIPSRAQRILRNGDTIVGTVRPGNGSYGLISDTGLTGSTGFAVLRPKKSHFRAYVYFATTSQSNIDRLSRLADGGAYPAVRPDVVSATPCVIPSEQLLHQLETVAGALLDRIAHSDRESRNLAALRDTLLPKLISGELRVPASLGSMQEVST